MYILLIVHCALENLLRRQISCEVFLLYTHKLQRGRRKFWEIMDMLSFFYYVMLIILIVVMVSQVNIYVKIHQIVYFKCVKFLAYQLYLNKVVFKKKKKELAGTE